MSEILAFTAENVCKLTGLSARQLAYWDATDFFSPELLGEHRRRAFGRIYSFRDVVGLRAIAVLRNEYRIPLQELRRVGEWLLSQHASPWSSLRFALSNRKVVFRDPDTQKFVEAKGKVNQLLKLIWSRLPMTCALPRLSCAIAVMIRLEQLFAIAMSCTTHGL